MNYPKSPFAFWPQRCSSPPVWDSPLRLLRNARPDLRYLSHLLFIQLLPWKKRVPIYTFAIGTSGLSLETFSKYILCFSSKCSVFHLTFFCLLFSSSLAVRLCLTAVLWGRRLVAGFFSLRPGPVRGSFVVCKVALGEVRLRVTH